VLRPLRPGRLIDAAKVSATEAETNYANNVARIASSVVRRSTAASVRVVPLEAVTHAGRVIGFVVAAAVTRAAPGVSPIVCVALPPPFRLVAAPGAIVTGSRLCWDSTDLINGNPQTFRFTARVASVPKSGAAFAVTASLSGANFAVARAAASVQVPPRPVACPSSVRRPRARVAC
jgi:hypothetical protein